ncbi:hypothetical protein H6G80_06135 [Nostoc sp. FACHB-87]|uniref:COG3650 family protein n=1 Tax=Nostocales TaxID=1161 RepID=UPI001687DB68|nr:MULTISPECIES: hypothetical protein [Nostocales]MBD2300420.1 hypothetical protein [Nostoc sp. FACHB-190]MBD2453655.1 hypothetical protein [Nostoc sp. FACHB-87]MBD2475390.1 hypothetical protein [Anabaena sp. FACHB-83]MBD2489840.1 hypothetical protein [Aulosira sp. FACHB-615]
MKAFISYIAFVGMSASLLAYSSSLQAVTPSNEKFIALGTEPFWSVTVSKNGIVYSSPEVKKQTFPYVKPLAAQARPADLVRVYRLRGNNTLILQKVSACSDGMSDKNYPYSAVLILGNKVLEGCAQKQ